VAEPLLDGPDRSTVAVGQVEYWYLLTPPTPTNPLEPGHSAQDRACAPQAVGVGVYHTPACERPQRHHA
jgi:hypothetical protein